jgi:hypothetical protein
MARPLERTKQHYQKAGWTVGIVERFNPHVPPRGIRQDLYGFIDAVAIRADQPGVTALQACSTDFAEHLVKIMENEHARTWLQAGNRIVLVAWTKSERGTGGWTVREREITLAEIERQRGKAPIIKEARAHAA